ncbi:MAG: choice-of-anchor J domain-containing protein, partial [Candidatus Cloacimonetes bacterium]|nr:choice-of-anchor J domain-containing protein [Candidatus Cloacimonadota bacterium]
VSDSLDLVITNYDAVDVVITQLLTITGEDADQFILIDNQTYPLTIAPNNDLIFNLRFAPTTTGHKTAYVTFNEGSNSTPHNVELHGYGYAPDGNDTSQTATEVPLYSEDIADYPAIIEPVDDVDWYVFWQTGPAVMEIHTENIEGSTVDLAAHLYGPYDDIGIAVPDSAYIFSDDNSWSDGVNPYLDITCQESGFYYLRIAKADNPPDSTRLDRWETNDYSLWIVVPNVPIPWTPDPPTDLEATVLYQGIKIDWLFPDYLLYGLAGFNIYRDDVLVNSNYIDSLFYIDTDESLVLGQTYEYKVTTINWPWYNESVPCDSILVTYTAPVFGDNFESYPDFSTEFGDWTNIDEDGENTFGFTNGIDFPGEGEPRSFIIFNPLATTPPLSSADAFSGAKYAAGFCNESEPSSNWLITPQILLSNEPAAIGFMARSFAIQFGPEQFEVCVSNGSSDVADFVVISGEQPVEVPPEWTLYRYELNDYAGQEIRIAVHSIAEGTFFLMLDDFALINAGGTVGLEENLPNPSKTALLSNYPNPFNPETEIRFELNETSDVTIDVFNIKGQFVKRIAEGNYTVGGHSIVWNGKDTQNKLVSSGVYFYKMQSGTYTKTRKMILMK